MLSIDVKPFDGLLATKEQGVKVLEEASEFREAFDSLAKAYQQYESEEHTTEEEREWAEIIGQLIRNFVFEGCDALQAVVNLFMSVFNDEEAVGNYIKEGMAAITAKNAERGWYKEEETEEENDGGAEA